MRTHRVKSLQKFKHKVRGSLVWYKGELSGSRKTVSSEFELYGGCSSTGRFLGLPTGLFCGGAGLATVLGAGVVGEGLAICDHRGHELSQLYLFL